MKNKNKLIIILFVVVILLILLIVLLPNKNNSNNSNKSNNNNDKNNTTITNNSKSKLLKYVVKMKKKNVNDYRQIENLNILNTNTSFRNYAFISDNKIYVFNPNKLDDGEFVYKKIYDISSDIKVMNIVPGYGSDISFYDYSDNLYTLNDDNLDNKVVDDYSMYENASYNNITKKENYSKEYLGSKFSYDFMSNYAYVNDNKLYMIMYGNEKYPTFKEIDSSYKGEKIIRIYNERIVKTDKSFYEIMKYFDTNTNETKNILVKIKSLTKYYDEVLTFTYKYVILKDYTIIPINDVMENRVRDYNNDYFLSGFNYMNEVRYEE